MTPQDALLAACMLHLGFQVVVTLLVYPGLVAVTPDRWPEVHAAHTRRIGPIVVVVYGALVVSAVLVVASDPTAAQVVAVVSSATAITITATVAGPAHGRLSPDRPDPVLRRLVVSDRVRLGVAVVGAVAATLATMAT
ncbi:hypothetical protein [Salsipaludibacter albus]|uniref:hypothetical protein n=1 Tax=Salsipaludibacter albus TaxID=2849650 RepID=UPI001EE4B33F|nr:hypothetical protein [Salsipaludibacter albus]MBY5161125.1 hypothetical protein [Salsipaludibacter albus]